MHLNFLKKTVSMSQKEPMPMRFLQEERSRKISDKERKHAADAVKSELGRKRQEKGIRELKGLKKCRCRGKEH